MMKLCKGNCLAVIPILADNSVDSIVTDPPYELGFMGKSWDNTGIAYNVEMWKECYRVLKPGGHLLAFGGTRTYHRMAVAIEDAGFEIRDMIEWVYGQGFPKSLNIGKAVDKLQGNEREEISENPNHRKLQETGTMVGEPHTGDGKLTKGTSEWEGWGTALKPSHEPICMARKPIEKGLTIAENCLKWGTGGLDIDGCRVETGDNLNVGAYSNNRETSTNKVYGEYQRINDDFQQPTGRFPSNLILSYAENEYLCKDNLSKEQKDKLYKWLNENT